MSHVGVVTAGLYAGSNFWPSQLWDVQLFWKTFFFFFPILYPINHTTILILSYLFQMSIFVYNPTMPIQKRSYIMLQCKKTISVQLLNNFKFVFTSSNKTHFTSIMQSLYTVLSTNVSDNDSNGVVKSSRRGRRRANVLG